MKTLKLSDDYAIVRQTLYKSDQCMIDWEWYEDGEHFRCQHVSLCYYFFQYSSLKELSGRVKSWDNEYECFMDYGHYVGKLNKHRKFKLSVPLNKYRKIPRSSTEKHFAIKDAEKAWYIKASRYEITKEPEWQKHMNPSFNSYNATMQDLFVGYIESTNVIDSARAYLEDQTDSMNKLVYGKIVDIHGNERPVANKIGLHETVRL